MIGMSVKQRSDIMSESRTRIILVAGIPKSGKTAVIRESAAGRRFDFIANNDESAEMMKASGCAFADVFPFKSPCARVRQFQFRVSNVIRQNSPDYLISEPPGSCLEVSSPMMNPFCLMKDKGIELAPLITVIKASELLEKGASKKNTDSFRHYNFINESDAVILSFADEIDDDSRDRLEEIVLSINEDAKIIFFSEGKEGANEITDIMFGDSEYHRPLVY